MEIGHGQFSHTFINRLTITQDCMIGLGDSAPVTIDIEKSDHVVEVWPDCFEVKKKRFMTLYPQRGRRDQSPFKAVCSPGFKRVPDGIVSLTLPFKVERQAIQEILDLLRGLEPLE